MDWFLVTDNLHARENFQRRNGWRYGLVFGIFFIFFGWGWDAIELAFDSVTFFWYKFAFALVALFPLCIFAGHFAAHLPRAIFKIILWSAFGALSGWLASHVPFEFASAVSGWLDPNARGIAVYPFSPPMNNLVATAIAFGIGIGALAGVGQHVTMRWAWNRSTKENQMTRASWLMLAACLPLAFTLGGGYDGLVNSSLRAPFHLTRRIIQIGLTAPREIEPSKLPIQQILDYANAARWRDNFSARYQQYLVDYDRRFFKQTYVDVEFDNGFLWRCRVLNYGQDSICRDLRADAREWITQFVRGSEIKCPDCAAQIAPSAAAFQSSLRGIFGDPRAVSVTHYSGGVIAARADFGTSAVRCLFVGGDPLIVQSCATE
ncbi:MAG: hypothetical protein HY070_01705 [Chloroflexi bacterium]|nr:hypothetical protein [Chloroflexota bacterium]